MSLPRWIVTVCSMALLPACASGDDTEKKEAAATGQGWQRVIEGSWTLDPGDEDPRLCVRKELTEDIYVHAIRPIHPVGSHHTLLTLGDGKTDCTTAVANGLLYGAGVGSEGLELPDGVAIKFPKGKFLNLGLHIYNSTTEVISGTSAMEIETMDADDVEFESEAVLAGPIDISVAPNEKKTIAGDCEITTDQKVYALFPHMHQYGKHIKTTFTAGGKTTVVHDEDYDFEEQFQLPLEPIVTLSKGDVVRTECTFDNTSAKTLTFGESSDTEMCFSILFRYPAQGQGFCTNAGRQRQATLDAPPCAAEGASGNAAGVGRECTKGGGECADVTATMCLAEFTQGGFGNFCTTMCDADDECGEGAKCSGESPQRICVPDSCAATLESARARGLADAGAPDAG